MTTRAADFIDIKRLQELAVEMHAASVYAGRATLDMRLFKNICIEAKRTHGDGSCLFVCEAGGIVEGFIIGVTDRVYGIGKERYATDFLFYVSERADKRDAMRLLLSFLLWARSSRGVIEIKLATSDAIDRIEPARLARVYKRFGLAPCGTIFRMEIAA